MRFSLRSLLLVTALVGIILAGGTAAPRGDEARVVVTLKLALVSALLYLIVVDDGKLRSIAKAALVPLIVVECVSTLLLMASSVATMRAERLQQLDADTWWQQQNVDGLWMVLTFVGWIAAILVAFARAVLGDASNMRGTSG